MWSQLTWDSRDFSIEADRKWRMCFTHCICSQSSYIFVLSTADPCLLCNGRVLSTDRRHKQSCHLWEFWFVQVRVAIILMPKLRLESMQRLWNELCERYTIGNTFKTLIKLSKTNFSFQAKVQLVSHSFCMRSLNLEFKRGLRQMQSSG